MGCFSCLESFKKTMAKSTTIWLYKCISLGVMSFPAIRNNFIRVNLSICQMPIQIINHKVNKVTISHRPTTDVSSSSLSFHSDEGITLETSVFESFVRWLNYFLDLVLIIYLSVSLSHRRSTQFLSKLNPISLKWWDFNLYYLPQIPQSKFKAVQSHVLERTLKTLISRCFPEDGGETKQIVTCLFCFIVLLFNVIVCWLPR